MLRDSSADRLEIVFDAADPTAAAAALILENGFVPIPERPATWGRPIDNEAVFQDLIDAERVLLNAAAMQPAETPLARNVGRGRRK